MKLLIIVLILLLLLSSCGGGYQNLGRQLVVVEEETYLMEEPLGITIKTLSMGSVVIDLSLARTDRLSNQWRNVKDSTGVEGWVMSSHLRVLEKEPVQ
jgi:hypothetical protein